MNDNFDYTDKQDKKLDKEITPTQTAASSLQEDPLQLGTKDASKKLERSKQILQKMIKLYTNWEAWRKPLENRWNEIYRLYFGNDAEIKTPTRAKIFVPMVFRVVEAAIPIIVNTIFSSDSFFEVVPLKPEEQDLAEVIQLLLEYQLAQASFYPKFIDFTKQLILYGTSYFKVYWKVKRQWVWEREPIRKPLSLFGIPFPTDKIVGWNETKSYKVIERRPEIDVLDILDVFPDPDAFKEDDGKGVFLRSYMDYDTVREMGAGKYPTYANTDSDDLKSSLKTDHSSYSSSRQQRFSTRGVSNQGGNSNQIEILEFWGKYDLDKDGIAEEVYIVIGNRTVLLKATGNPFQHQKRPLVKSSLFPVPLEWYGIGLIEPIIDQQYELNTIRRQRLDNINLIINNMWQVKDTADIDLNSLVSTPGGIILTGDMESLMPLRPSNETSAAYVESQALQAEIFDTTVSKGAQGTPESGRLGRTASGAKMIISQSLEKFGTTIRLLEETALKRVLKLMHQLNLQFLDDDEVLVDPGLYGSLIENMTPEMLRADVQFKMVGIGEMIGKEAKINQGMTFLGMFKDVMTPETVTMLMQKVWKLMGFDEKELKKLQGAPPSNVRSAVASDVGDVKSAQAVNEINANGADVPPQSGLNQGR